MTSRTLVVAVHSRTASAAMRVRQAAIRETMVAVDQNTAPHAEEIGLGETLDMPGSFWFSLYSATNGGL